MGLPKRILFQPKHPQMAPIIILHRARPVRFPFVQLPERPYSFQPRPLSRILTNLPQHLHIDQLLPLLQPAAGQPGLDSKNLLRRRFQFQDVHQGLGYEHTEDVIVNCIIQYEQRGNEDRRNCPESL
jgi:hypothetical protein